MLRRSLGSAVLTFAFAFTLAAAGCCTNDLSFYGRVRQANDASVERALGARAMTLVPAQRDAVRGDPGTAVVLNGAYYTGGAARDAAGVIHPIVVHPRVRSTESHHLCACEPHGGTPPPILVDFVPVEAGSVGPPIELDVDELIDLEVGQSRCGGPPRP